MPYILQNLELSFLLSLNRPVLFFEFKLFYIRFNNLVKQGFQLSLYNKRRRLCLI